jgi:hypothetical protein
MDGNNMRDIHFISLFCVDFDQSIMKNWVENIKRYNFASYSVVLNSPSNDGVLMSYCASYLAHQGFNCTVDGRKFDNIRLRVDVLDSFRRKMLRDYPDDYMCVCDSDELPLLPVDISTILKNLPNKYFIKGELIDRWNTTLEEGDADGDLFERFPYEGNLEKKLKDEAIDAIKQYFFEMCRDKYLIFPLDAQMDMTGCHVIHGPAPINVWPCKYKIMHFTWREGIIDRMMLKSFNHPYKIDAVMEFFSKDKGSRLCLAMT